MAVNLSSNLAKLTASDFSFNVNLNELRTKSHVELKQIVLFDVREKTKSKTSFKQVFGTSNLDDSKSELLSLTHTSYPSGSSEVEIEIAGERATQKSTLN